MKKSFVLVAAGLMTLAACDTNTPAQENVLDAGDNAAAQLDNMSDNFEDAADNATTTTMENQMEGAADQADNAADNATAVAENKAEAMER